MSKVTVVGAGNVGASSDKHTDSNLTRRRDLLITFGERAENEHNDRSENDDEEWVDTLPNFGSNRVGCYEIASEDRKGLSVLVEREPEEYGNAEHSEKSVETLLDFLGIGLLFGFGYFDDLFLFFSGVRQRFSDANENSQRD